MTCSELINDPRLATEVNLDRYDKLHSEGRQLISGWFTRAWAMKDCKPADSFEPFIFTWISFNGWAACITELDRDRDWLVTLMQSQRIYNDFSRLILNDNSPVAIYAHKFYKIWPVFKAQDIRRRRLPQSIMGKRQEVIEHYLAANIKCYEPQCWRRHRDEGSPVPLDRPHTLAALYRVRCNLFHGEKSAYSEMDIKIVATAFRILIHFIQQAGYIHK